MIAVPLFFITLPITEGHRGLPFAPGRTFIPLPHPGFQPPTQALYRFRWDYSFRSSRYETTLHCTTGYTGLSSHPMMEERKCSRCFTKRLPCPVSDGGKRSAVAEVNDSPVDCHSLLRRGRLQATVSLLTEGAKGCPSPSNLPLAREAGCCRTGASFAATSGANSLAVFPFEFRQPDPGIFQLSINLMANLLRLNSIKFPKQPKPFGQNTMLRVLLRHGSIFRTAENRSASIKILIVKPSVIHSRQAIAAVRIENSHFFR